MNDSKRIKYVWLALAVLLTFLGAGVRPLVLGAWLAPIFLILILFGILLVFTETSVVAPFIYTLF